MTRSVRHPLSGLHAAFIAGPPQPCSPPSTTGSSRSCPWTTSRPATTPTARNGTCPRPPAPVPSRCSGRRRAMRWPSTIPTPPIPERAATLGRSARGIWSGGCTCLTLRPRHRPTHNTPANERTARHLSRQGLFFQIPQADRTRRVTRLRWTRISTLTTSVRRDHQCESGVRALATARRTRRRSQQPTRLPVTLRLPVRRRSASHCAPMSRGGEAPLPRPEWYPPRSPCRAERGRT